MNKSVNFYPIRRIHPNETGADTLQVLLVQSEAQDDIGDDDDDDNNFIKVSCLIAKGFTNRGFFEVLSIPETMKLNST